MQDTPRSFKTPLTGMGWSAWLQAADEIVEADGHVEALGPDHAAVFYEDKPILLVTFETHRGIARLSQPAHPLGWSMVKALGWSHLCVVANGDTWFRDRHVYGYFDRLADDGFFDEFEQVIFYGAGACGYAAAAFSVAAPGAKVLALQPQATLDPRVTEWDHRFPHMRRTAFDDRYGYAPDMLDAATRAVVIYDPEMELDAMHAALFTRPNVIKFRVRHLGDQLEHSLMSMGVLLRILAQLSADKLDRLALAQLFRERRTHVPYLKRVLAKLEHTDRLRLTALWCQCILRRTPGPRFRRSARAAYEAAEAQGVAMPEREVD
ncbi:MAG TPA: phosphoadenosine phosphosulfate reductase [Roseovarius sp.]|nr:phosphoadenosine phosphosulfate reductase [Roseovarius sp.]